MSSKFDTERLCRLNGKKPSARDRWIAFHRLWRLSHGHGATHDMDASDCFRVLFSSWQGIRLLDHHTPILSRVGWPVFLRKRFLDMDKRRRLGLDNNLEHFQKVCRKLRNEKGMEVTPMEVAEVRHKLIKLVREKAFQDGISIPTDDDELFQWLTQKD